MVLLLKVGKEEAARVREHDVATASRVLIVSESPIAAVVSTPTTTMSNLWRSLLRASLPFGHFVVRGHRGVCGIA